MGFFSFYRKLKMAKEFKSTSELIDILNSKDVLIKDEENASFEEVFTC